MRTSGNEHIWPTASAKSPYAEQALLEWHAINLPPRHFYAVATIGDNQAITLTENCEQSLVKWRYFNNYHEQPVSLRIYCAAWGFMTEGWFGDEHLILFDEREVTSASDRYGILQSLPGYRVIGLRGWDDFILQDSMGRTYSVETVPPIAEYLKP